MRASKCKGIGMGACLRAPCQTGRWIRRNAAKINPPDKPDRPTSIFRLRLPLFSRVGSVRSLLFSLTQLILIPFHIFSSPFSESGNYAVPVGGKREGRGFN